MSSDLVSIISNIVKDFEEKHSPIVIDNLDEGKHTITWINKDRYKWTSEDFTDALLGSGSAVAKVLTKKGLLMYYKKWFINVSYAHIHRIEFKCGICEDVIFSSDHCDEDEFAEECIEKLEWFLEFQQECFE